MKERKGKNQKWRSTRKDYRMYHFTGKETAKYLLEGAAICAAADYLFYQSLPVLLFMLPIPVLFLKLQRKKCTARQQRELNYQFRDALTAMNVAVQAGYSAENAVRASVKDLGRLYEKGSDILDEFRYIESQLRLSVPVEELFLDLGKRSGVEDIENFAAVFYTAKRTGGDMTQVIQKVARMLSDKIEVKKEIEATLAALCIICPRRQSSQLSRKKSSENHHKYHNMYPHYQHLHFYIYDLYTKPVRKSINCHTNCHCTDSKKIPIQYIHKSRRSQFQITDNTSRHYTHNHLL